MEVPTSSQRCGLVRAGEVPTNFQVQELDFFKHFFYGLIEICRYRYLRFIIKDRDPDGTGIVKVNFASIFPKKFEESLRSIKGVLRF